MTANCHVSGHLQSMIYATDAISMELMLYPPPKADDSEWSTGYSTCYNTFHDAVQSEIWTTSMIQEAGYHVMAMMGS